MFLVFPDALSASARGLVSLTKIGRKRAKDADDAGALAVDCAEYKAKGLLRYRMGKSEILSIVVIMITVNFSGAGARVDGQSRKFLFANAPVGRFLQDHTDFTGRVILADVEGAAYLMR